MVGKKSSATFLYTSSVAMATGAPRGLISLLKAANDGVRIDSKMRITCERGAQGV